MNKFIYILLFLMILTLQAKAEEPKEKDLQALQKEVEILKINNNQLNSSISAMKSEEKKQSLAIDRLQRISEINSSNIAKLGTELESKIEDTNKTATQRIAALNNSLSRNTIYWAMAFMIGALLSGVIYLLLKKRIYAGNILLDQQINQTKKALEEEGIRLDNKLVEVLEGQLKLMENRVENSSPTLPSSNQEVDHSLALKVADEIVRIQMNLNYMDPSVKGLKQLDRATKSIVDNFRANGYEIPELLNKPYNQGMNFVATMEPDEKLSAGQQIIRRIIKPQVNYKGVMIQAAQIVVAYGE